MNSELRLLAILSSVIAVIFLGSFFVMAGHEDIIGDAITFDVEEEVVEETPVETDIVDEDTTEPEVVEPEGPEVESVTGLLIGIDATGGLTDVLMVANFDVETNEVKLVSVPRDLEIQYSEEPFKTLRNSFNDMVNAGDVEADLHQRSYSKVNEIYYDTGKTKAGLYYTKEVVEKITNMDIDYIAVIDVYGFKDVVDAVGGVEFDVPQRMYYNDSAQDLHIDLQPGLQLLDGEHAMQMVRYRKYLLGDLQRIQVQQEFMTALFKKIVDVRDLDQIMNIVSSIYPLFDSDFGLNVALEYVTYAFDLELNDLLNPENMVTIPSWGYKEEYEVDGEIHYRYHQLWDMDEAHETVEELMNR